MLRLVRLSSTTMPGNSVLTQLFAGINTPSRDRRGRVLKVEKGLP